MRLSLNRSLARHLATLMLFACVFYEMPLSRTDITGPPFSSLTRLLNFVDDSMTIGNHLFFVLTNAATIDNGHILDTHKAQDMMNVGRDKI